MKILQKVFLVAFVPTALAAALVLLLAWRLNHLAVLDRLRTESHVHLEILRQNISSRFAGIQAVLADEAVRLLPGEPGKVLPELRALEGRLGRSVDGVFLDLPDGEVLGLHGERFNTQDRYYYPLLRQGAPVITRIVNSKSSGQPSVIVLSPQMGKNGDYLGALAASVPVSGLLQAIRDYSPGVGGEAALLVDDSGRVEAARKNFVINSNLVHQVLAAEDGDADMDIPGIGKQHLLFTRVVGTPWKLAWLQPQPYLLPAQRPMLIVLLLIFFATVAVGAAGYHLLKRLISRPVQELIAAHAALAQGDRSVRVERLGCDEFSTLASSFNQMAEQLQHSEAALRASEKQFKTLFDLAPYSCAVSDLEGRYLLVNRAFGHDFGFDLDAFIGHTPEELGFNMETQVREIAVAELARSGAAHMLQAEVIKGAETFNILFSSQAITFAGQPAFLTITVNISEQKRAERALRKSEERSRLLLGNSNDILTVVDATGNQILINGPVWSTFGYQPEELLGTSGFNLVHPDDLEPVSAVFAKALSNPGIVHRIEFRARHKNGTWIWMEAMGNNLLHEPAIGGVVLNIRNIAERKRAEAEREKLQSQLIQACKMESIGRLAGGVAHDFNNMLQVILGNAALALDGLPPQSPVWESLDEIQICAHRSADLTRQLLAFARKQTIAPKVLDLNETVTGMLKMLRRLIGEDIDLSWRPGAELGSVMIDPSQVDQLLANLCVNARDAMVGTGGKLTIETANIVCDEAYVAHQPEAQVGDYVRLAVSDNGCGLRPEVREHLFEPFFTTKEPGHGTGMGLATVYGIAKQNRGFITVYSELSRGTTFQIHLPRHASRALLPANSASVSALGMGCETILLVEDEVSILKVSQKLLEKLGYRVLAARTPGEAMQWAREHAGQIHLLMTDVVMPEMNGRDLAKNLLCLYPGLKRLFMSGYTADVIAHHGVLDPGTHFLQKPFSQQDLAGKVREVLDATA